MLNRSLAAENQTLVQLNQKKVQELLDINQRLNDENNQLKNDLKARDVKSIEILLGRMDQELEKREKLLNEKNREIEKLNKEIENFKADLAKKDEEIKLAASNSTTKITSLETQVAGLKKDKEKAEFALKDKEQQLNDLKQKHASTENDYWGLRAEFQSRIPFFESEVERLTKEKQAKEHHIEQLVAKLDEINALEDRVKLAEQNKLLKSKFVIVCAELERVKEKNQNLEDIIAEWLGATDRGLLKVEELTNKKKAKELLGDPYIALITQDDHAREAREAEEKKISATQASAEIRVFNPENQEIVGEHITATELTKPTEPNQPESTVVELKAELDKVIDLVEQKITTEVQDQKTETVQQPEGGALQMLGGIVGTALNTKVEDVKISVELNVFYKFLARD